MAERIDSAPSRRRRRPGFGAALLLVTVGLGVGALLAEGLLRVLPEPAPPRYRMAEPAQLFVADTTLGWRSIANGRWRIRHAEYDVVVTTDSLGLRRSLPDGVDTACVVIALGDSFVQGLAVSDDEHFAAHAERGIVARGGQPCTVVPLGAEGYATYQQLHLLYRMLARVRPTLVVHFPYHNDVLCNLPEVTFYCEWTAQRRAAFRLEGDTLVPVTAVRPEVRADTNAQRYSPSGLIPRARKWLGTHSRLYGLLGRSVRGAIVFARRGRPIPWSAAFDRPLHFSMETFRRDWRADTQEGWRLTMALMRAIRDTSEATGAQFAMLHVPLRESVQPEQWQRFLRWQQLDADDWDPARMETEMRAFCEALAVPCVFPAEAMRQRWLEEGVSSYLRKDPHWSAAGHQLVGDMLADAVVAILDGR